MSAFKELCRQLPWDSQFFGFPVARVQKTVVTAEDMQDILTWCRLHKIRCLYFLARSDNSQSVRLAEANDFNLVDIRVDMEWSRSRGPLIFDEGCSGEIDLREARPEDLPELEAMAQDIFQVSRFWVDPGFPRPKVKEMFAIWVRKGVRGEAEKVFVAEEDGRLAGYIVCHLESDRIGRFGIQGMDRDFQNRRVGRALLARAMNWYAQQGVDRVFSATQGRNVACQRLYQHQGFMTCTTELWFHKWFPALGEEENGD